MSQQPEQEAWAVPEACTRYARARQVYEAIRRSGVPLPPGCSRMVIDIDFASDMPVKAYYATWPDARLLDIDFKALMDGVPIVKIG